MATAARDHIIAGGKLPEDEDVLSWLDGARDRIAVAASGQGAELRDFASTMVLLISTGSATLVAHVGDGCAVARLRRSGEWSALSWPENGEYASTTFFVTDDPEPRLRISRVDDEVNAIALMTDGVERLALDFAEMQAHGPFFEGMIAPVAALDSAGKDSVLSDGLSRFLSSEPVLARTDDDKTLILAALQR